MVASVLDQVGSITLQSVSEKERGGGEGEKEEGRRERG